MVDDAKFLDAMASVCTPVTVVTTFAADDPPRPHGTTVGAFCSLSVRPKLVMFALDCQSGLLGLLAIGSRVGINVLGSGDGPLAAVFATKGRDKFRDISWREVDRAPRLDAAATWIAGDVTDIVDGGDHRIVVAEVVTVDVAERPPLTFHRRAFGTHAQTERHEAYPMAR